MTIVTAIFIAACIASLAVPYVKIGASVQRAMDARLHGRAWILVGFIALLWPVTLPALVIRDLLMHDRYSPPLMMSEGAWRRKVLAQEGAAQLRDEAEIQRVHGEWQSRVNYFYALGEEAERTDDWVLGQLVADNLEFLLETEPPRPPEKVERPVAKKADKPEWKDPRRTKPKKAVSPPPEVESHDETPAGYCDLCATHREKSHFPHYRITGT